MFGRAISFNPKTRTFEISNSENSSHIPLSEMDDIGKLYISAEHGLKRDGEYFLALRGFRISVLPNLRRYVAGLNEEEWEALREEVCSVMSSISSPDSRNSRISKRDLGFVGIRAQRLDSGLFILQTIGNCACLGPEMNRSHRHNLNLSQDFGLHNVDTVKQHLSLLAGIGTLAWFAKESVKSP